MLILCDWHKNSLGIRIDIDMDAIELKALGGFCIRVNVKRTFINDKPSGMNAARVRHVSL